MGKGRGQKVSRRDLAAIFGVSLPTIDAWVRAGCPYDQKGGRGKEWTFDTADVARWREDRAAADAGSQDIDADKLRIRRIKADTMLAELELAKAQALVAPLDQVERVLSRAVAEVQTNLRGRLITRLVTQLLGETDERRFKRVALSEVDDVLVSLADIDITADEPDDQSEDEETASDD
jgi:phage terminase Nu1 subunit (DNA packaging protein)